LPVIVGEQAGCRIFQALMVVRRDCLHSKGYIVATLAESTKLLLYNFSLSNIILWAAFIYTTELLDGADQKIGWK